MSTKIQGPPNASAATVVERGLSPAAKPSAAWTHARCSDSLSVRHYDRLVQQLATFDYLCNACLISTLPFAHTQENADDISISVAFGAGKSQANDDDISTSTMVAGGAGDTPANGDDISTTVAAGDSQANDDDISATVAFGASESQANDNDISTSTTIAGGGVYSQAIDKHINHGRWRCRRHASD